MDAGAREFFRHKITIFVNGTAPQEKVDKVRGRLAGLDFPVDVVPCEQYGHISLYHRGDVISGSRLDPFLAYAEWLHEVRF